MPPTSGTKRLYDADMHTAALDITASELSRRIGITQPSMSQLVTAGLIKVTRLHGLTLISPDEAERVTRAINLSREMKLPLTSLLSPRVQIAPDCRAITFLPDPSDMDSFECAS